MRVATNEIPSHEIEEAVKCAILDNKRLTFIEMNNLGTVESEWLYNTDGSVEEVFHTTYSSDEENLISGYLETTVKPKLDQIQFVGEDEEADLKVLFRHILPKQVTPNTVYKIRHESPIDQRMAWYEALIGYF
jgi:hypothetical protein